MKGPKKELTTSKLLSFIKQSNSIQDVNLLFETQPIDKPTFNGYLYTVMEKNMLTPKEIIISSGLERSYFYHILSGKKVPGRNIVIRIALCISATLNETNNLLRLAQHSPLYSKIRRDAILIFAITNHYTMSEANDLLQEEKETPLYKEFRK